MNKRIVIDYKKLRDHLGECFESEKSGSEYNAGYKYAIGSIAADIKHMKEEIKSPDYEAIAEMILQEVIGEHLRFSLCVPAPSANELHSEIKKAIIKILKEENDAKD